ncbi:MAG: hypothetical protein ND866_20040, partial [Pyrinomonadaceae bacterium]|nr:hypothetical protein [Pyrinomonadaceae bacterium]
IDRRTGQYGKSDLILVDNSILTSLFMEMVLTNFERNQISISEFYSHPSKREKGVGSLFRFASDDHGISLSIQAQGVSL